MSSKIEVSRDLANRLAKCTEGGFWPEGSPLEELRVLLAAPVVERQDSEAKPLLPSPGVFEIGEVNMRNSRLFGTGSETPVVFDEKGAVHLNLEGWTLYAPGAQPALVSVSLPSREVMRDLIAEVIGGDTYDCTRVWSAWGVVTMSEDDFVPFTDQDERLYELADACLDKVKELNQCHTY